MYYVFECSMLQQCRSCASMIFICHRLLFQNGYILLTSQSGLSNWFQLTTFCSFIANGFCHCQWTLDIFVLPLTGFSLVAVFVLNLWKLHFEDNFRQNFCFGIYYGDSLQTNAAFNADAIASYYKHFFRPDIWHCKCDNVRLWWLLFHKTIWMHTHNGTS